MMPYSAGDWYWVIPGVDDKVFSAAASAMVSGTDKSYVAFLAAGNKPSRLNPALSREDAFAELYEVLREQAPATANGVEAEWRKEGYLKNMPPPRGRNLDLDASQAEIIAKCVGAHAEEVRAWSAEEIVAALAAVLHRLAEPGAR